MADFSWDTEYNIVTQTVTTVANQAEYDLTVANTSPHWIYITDCLYGTTISLRETDEGQIRDRDPLWLVATAGQPTWYWMPTPSVLRLHPKPDTGSITLTLRGAREATALSAGGDIPGFPSTWHEAIALRAALLQMEVWTQGEETQRMAWYRDQYNGMVTEMREWINSNNVQMQRTVMHRPTMRISRGTQATRPMQ